MKNLIAQIGFLLLPLTLLGQGSLTPPSGAPVASMKSLAQIEPRYPISIIPTNLTVPGAYYFTTNISYPAASPVGSVGITISVDNLSLDLNGFSLLGVNRGNVGVLINGNRTNLVIHNGAISGWITHGVDSFSTGYPRGVMIEKIIASYNGLVGLYCEAGTIIKDCIATQNRDTGIYSSGDTVSYCIARNNGSYGFNCVQVQLDHCVATGNTNHGFLLTSSHATDSLASGNAGWGFKLSNSSLRGGHSDLNTVGGASADSGSTVRDAAFRSNSGPGVYTDNSTVENCQISLGSANALIVNGESRVMNNSIHDTAVGFIGISITNNFNHIDGNSLMNSARGIVCTNATSTHNAIVRNTLVNSGVNLEVIANNTVGPIATSTTITNAAPWANIIY